GDDPTGGRRHQGPAGSAGGPRGPVLQLRRDETDWSDRGTQSGGGKDGAAALQGAALVLAHTAPDSAVLAGLQSPLQTGGADRATAAYLFGLFDLDQSRTGGADRKEQFGVFVTAGSVMAPVHAGHSSR